MFEKIVKLNNSSKLLFFGISFDKLDVFIDFMARVSNKEIFFIPKSVEIQIIETDDFLAKAENGKVFFSLNYVKEQIEKGEKGLYHIGSTFIHELIHIYQDKVSNNFKVLEKKMIRYDYLQKKLLGDLDIVNLNSIIFYLRTVLESFFSSIAMEGTARFGEFFLTSEKNAKLLSSKESLLKNYEESHVRVEKLKIKFEKLFEYPPNKKLLLQNIDSYNDDHILKLSHSAEYRYFIGKHMTQVILFYDDMDFEGILELSNTKFIKLYEYHCLNNNLKPVISYFSGKGVLDYKKLLDELNSLHKYCESKNILDNDLV